MVVKIYCKKAPSKPKKNKEFIKITILEQHVKKQK